MTLICLYDFRVCSTDPNSSYLLLRLSSRRFLRFGLVRYVRYPPTAITAINATMYKNIAEPIKVVDVSMTIISLEFSNNYASAAADCKVNKFSSGVSSSERKRAA